MTRPALPAQAPPPRLALSGSLTLADAEVVALPVLTEPAEGGDRLLLGPGAEEVGRALGTDLLAVLEAQRATGVPGEVVVLPVAVAPDEAPALRQALLVGVGGGSRTDLRRAGAALGRAVRGRSEVVTTLAAVADDAIAPVVAGVVLGSFAFHWRSAPQADPPVRTVVLAGPPGTEQRTQELDRAVAVASAGWRSRFLATVPANLKNPPWMAEQAEQLARDAGLEVTVWDERRLADEGFGGVLAVGRGSATPPRLVRLDYAPRRSRRRTPTVALVGKGITFDTGGLSIKPGEAMSTMKRDMSGGAVVMATMAALADVGCDLRVVGLVPAAENAISGDSMRPGDVVRHYGGRTSEVTNTDAEGRLVLADALAYAVAEVEPDVVVDVATLTAGVKVALGQQVGGLFATDDALAAALLAAGEREGEPLWRFPLHAGYEDKLRSKVADADNGPKGPASIMAALFLQPFVGGRPWAHLDLASVGDVPEDRHEWTAGPSGFGSRLLLDWLGSPDPLAGVAR